MGVRDNRLTTPRFGLQASLRWSCDPWSASAPSRASRLCGLASGRARLHLFFLFSLQNYTFSALRLCWFPPRYLLWPKILQSVTREPEAPAGSGDRLAESLVLKPGSEDLNEVHAYIYLCKSSLAHVHVFPRSSLIKSSWQPNISFICCCSVLALTLPINYQGK